MTMFGAAGVTEWTPGPSPTRVELRSTLTPAQNYLVLLAESVSDGKITAPQLANWLNKRGRAEFIKAFGN